MKVPIFCIKVDEPGSIFARGVNVTGHGLIPIALGGIVPGACPSRVVDFNQVLASDRVVLNRGISVDESSIGLLVGVLNSGETSLHLIGDAINFILNEPPKFLLSREVQVSEVGPPRRPVSIGTIGALAVRRGGSAVIKVSHSRPKAAEIRLRDTLLDSHRDALLSKQSREIAAKSWVIVLERVVETVQEHCAPEVSGGVEELGREEGLVLHVIGVEDRAVGLHSGGKVGLGLIEAVCAICVANLIGDTVEGVQMVECIIVRVRLFNREPLRRNVVGRVPCSNTRAGGALVVSTIQCTVQGVLALVSQ